MRLTAPAAALALALVVAGCGDGDTARAPGSRGPSADTSAGTAPGTASEPSGTATGPGTTPEPADGSGPAADGTQSGVFDRMEGNTDGACIAVAGRRDVRSGGIVGGPFDTAASAWGKAQPGLAKDNVTLYWVPLHAGAMRGVTVVATHASSGSRVRAATDSYNLAEQWKYYTTSLELPTAGTWRLKVTAGPDAGCFDLDLKN